MEQTVWIWVGVMAVILGLGAFSNLVSEYIQDRNAARMQVAVDELTRQCNFVCDSTPGTNLSTDITISPPTNIHGNRTVICGEYNDESYCQRCDCQLTNQFNVDLTGGFASEFDSITYDCDFANTNPGIEVSCAG